MSNLDLLQEMLSDISGSKKKKDVDENITDIKSVIYKLIEIIKTRNF